MIVQEGPGDEWIPGLRGPLHDPVGRDERPGNMAHREGTGARYKPLWIIASLFGFFGFATSWSPPGDLYMQVGIQIPVLMIWMTGSAVVLKAMFPVLAVVALFRFHTPRQQANE